MKIAVFDPYKGKFFQDMVDKWTAEGHEVRYERYFNPEMVVWGDLIWFETCDNNFHVASTGMTGADHHEDWDMHNMNLEGKQVIVRVIDIEAWYGHHNAGDWNLVDDVIFIAPHIKDLVKKDVDFGITNTRTHVIPCGVNMALFNPGQKFHNPEKIAWVCERWPTKGIDYALQIMAMLPKHYELHALGTWNDRHAWEEAYQKDFIKMNHIVYVEYDFVPDIGEWYENKGHILSCSKKEGFGYSIAEGMAKGLHPVVHTFYGARDIWPEDIRWDTVDEAVEMILHPSQLDPREILTDLGYTFNKMYERILEVIW